MEKLFNSISIPDSVDSILLSVPIQYKSNHNYVIVGGGTAGCYLASKISENIENDVLLLELGENATEQLESVLKSEDDDQHFTNKYVIKSQNLKMSNEDSHFANISGFYSHGKVLGGSSMISNGLAIRPPISTFDEWIPYTGNSWDYLKLQQTMKQFETFNGISQSQSDRGTNGPLQIRQSTMNTDTIIDMNVKKSIADSISDAIINVSGASALLDYNANDAEICVSKFPQFTQCSINNKTVRSHSCSFLKNPIDVINNRKLTIKTEAMVKRILFSGDIAIGVEYEYQGKIWIARASKKVILTAGAQTPLLLLRSGIGPSNLLEKFNLPQIYINPYVGKNLQNHLRIPMFIKSSINEDFINANSFPEDLGISVVSFLPNLNVFNDIRRKWQVTVVTDPWFIDPNFKSIIGISKNRQTFMLLGTDLNPTSRGEILLNDNKTNSNPLIKANFFTTSEDINNIVDLYIQMWNIYKELKTLNPNDGYALIWPPENLFESNNRQMLFQIAASSCILAQNWCGTTRMAPIGNDPQSQQGVVNPENLHVWGVQNVMVADINVCPVLPRADTLITTLTIAAKAFEFV